MLFSYYCYMDSYQLGISLAKIHIIFQTTKYFYYKPLDESVKNKKTSFFQRFLLD